MGNTRVKEIMAMLETETDPDRIEILQFDLAEAMGRKDAGMKKGVRRRSGGGSEMTDKQKKFAARQLYTFVHRIIDTGVWFGQKYIN